MSSGPRTLSRYTMEDYTISPSLLSPISEEPLQETLMETESEPNLSRIRRTKTTTHSSSTGPSPLPKKKNWKLLTPRQSELKLTASFLSLEEESSPTKLIISGPSSQDTPSQRSSNSSTKLIFPSTKLSKGTQTYKEDYRLEGDRWYPSFSKNKSTWTTYRWDIPPDTEQTQLKSSKTYPKTLTRTNFIMIRTNNTSTTQDFLQDYFINEAKADTNSSPRKERTSKQDPIYSQLRSWTTLQERPSTSLSH